MAYMFCPPKAPPKCLLVQNTAVVLTSTRMCECISPVLDSLRWLSDKFKEVYKNIIFKETYIDGLGIPSFHKLHHEPNIKITLLTGLSTCSCLFMSTVKTYHFTLLT